MAFDTLTEFIQMNGHGVFVWSAYFAVFTVFVFLCVQSVLGRRRVMLEIRGMVRREQAQQQNQAEKANTDENS